MSGFHYVYMLQSQSDPKRYYVGITESLENRIEYHNAGRCPHTSKFRPWQIETVVAFFSKGKAATFEKYLKSHSGRAFAKKHF